MRKSQNMFTTVKQSTKQNACFDAIIAAFESGKNFVLLTKDFAFSCLEGLTTTLLHNKI